MINYSAAQAVRAVLLFLMLGVLLLPVVAKGEEGTEATLIHSSPSTLSGLSLSLTEESLLQDLSNSADWKGLKTDTARFLGYQLAIIGVLWVAPTSISGWTDETKDDFSIQQYKDNVRRVVWDKDDWWINYVLHPYWGGTYYVRARQRGFSPVGAFWYSASLSTIYEFGAEAFFEEPSIQDLIVTPVAGYFVGKYFMEVRNNIRKKSKKTGQLSGRDKFVMIMTDPLGAMNQQVDRLFGRTTRMSLRPMVGPQFRTPLASENRFGEPRQRSYTGSSDFGVKLSLRW